MYAFFQSKSSEREEACQAGEIVYNLYKGMGRLLSGAREESKREDCWERCRLPAKDQHQKKKI